MPLRLGSFDLLDIYSKQNKSRDKYAFKLIDATDNEGLKVLVLDGEVNGQLPEGMGNDDFYLKVVQGNATIDDKGNRYTEGDIYVRIDYNLDSYDIEDNGISVIACKPEDLPEDELGVKIIKLGYVNIVTPKGQDTPTVNVVNTHLGDIFFDPRPSRSYSFEMFDASDSEGAKVRITPGAVIDEAGKEWIPVGMEGGEDGTAPAFIAGTLQDGWDVFLTISHDSDGEINSPVTIEWAEKIKDDNDFVTYKLIGFVDVLQADDPSQGDAIPQAVPHNSLCGDYYIRTLADENRYSFELLDASDNEGAKVLIMDGQVYGPNDDGTMPAGMGGDNYILQVNDNDEIYLIITINNDDNDVTSVTIAKGQSTPDDIQTKTQSTMFVTIGYCSVIPAEDEGDTPFVNTTNALCGDYVISHNNLDVTDDEDNQVHGVDQMNFIGAVSIKHDPTDENPNAVDVTIGIDVEDAEKGGEKGHLSKANTIIFDGAAKVTGADGIAHVLVGLDVEDAGSEGGSEFDSTTEKINTMIFHYAEKGDGQGDSIIDQRSEQEYVYVRLPTFDVLDSSGDGQVFSPVLSLVFKTDAPEDKQPNMVEDIGDSSNIAQITIPSLLVDGEDDEGNETNVVDPCYAITFTQETPDSPYNIVVPNEDAGGDFDAALVYLLRLDIDDGEGGTVIGTQSITFERGVDEDNNIVTDDGEGQATVHLPIADVAGDEGFVEQVNLFTFIAADDSALGYIEVEDDGDGEAVVSIPLLPENEDGGVFEDPQVLLCVDGSVDWWDFSQPFYELLISDESYNIVTSHVYAFAADGGFDDIIANWISENSTECEGGSVEA